MKRILAGMVVAAALSGSAFAADLPARGMYAKAPALAAPVYDWTGFYIGGHLGGAWDQSDWTFPTPSFFSDAGNTIGFRSSGWLGGGHVGYNYQINHLVVGLEGTWSAADIKNTVISPFFPAFDRETTKISSLYTVAGRAGATWDRFLIYGKGGWAGGQVELSAASTDRGGVFWNPGSKNRSGWVAGGGVEYMLTSSSAWNTITLTSAQLITRRLIAV